MQTSKSISRILAIILSVLLLLMQTGITAFAEEPEPGDAGQAVTGSEAGGDAPALGYSSPIAPMSFAGGWMELSGVTPGGLQAAVEADLASGDGQTPSAYNYAVISRLSVYHGSLDAADLAFIESRLTGLTDLDLIYTDVTWDLSELSGLTGLTYLSLYDAGISGDLSSLSGMTGLSYLDLRQNFTVSGNLSALSGMTGMTDLWLSNTSVSGELSALRGMTGLNALDLNSIGITGHLTEVSGMTGLTILGLYGTSVTGELSALRGMTGLTFLYLNNTSVTGNLSALSGMIGLQQFGLDGTAVAGDVADLASLTSLSYCYLSNLSITLPEITFAGSPIAVAIPVQDGGAALTPQNLTGGSFDPATGTVIWNVPTSPSGVLTYDFSQQVTVGGLSGVTFSGTVNQPYAGGGSSSSGRSSSSGSSGGSSTPDSARAKTQLPASAFSWDGERTLTIDHDSVTPLGLLGVRWDDTPTTAYTVHSGSVVIRFGEDFIAAQKDGQHTVRVEFMNHYGEYTLTLGAGSTAAADPQDNDTHNPNTGGYPTGQANGTDNPETGGGRGIWAALLAGSLSAAALVILQRGGLAANAPE